MADQHGSAGARLGAGRLLNIGRTMTRGAVMDDLGHVVDMRVDSMPALATGKLIGRRRGRRHEP